LQLLTAIFTSFLGKRQHILGVPVLLASYRQVKLGRNLEETWKKLGRNKKNRPGAINTETVQRAVKIPHSTALPYYHN
jgi:hypothetical protein